MSNFIHLVIPAVIIISLCVVIAAQISRAEDWRNAANGWEYKAQCLDKYTDHKREIIDRQENERKEIEVHLYGEIRHASIDDICTRIDGLKAETKVATDTAALIAKERPPTITLQGETPVIEFAEMIGVRPFVVIHDLMDMNVFRSSLDKIDFNNARAVANKRGFRAIHISEIESGFDDPENAAGIRNIVVKPA